MKKSLKIAILSLSALSLLLIGCEKPSKRNENPDNRNQPRKEVPPPGGNA